MISVKDNPAHALIRGRAATRIGFPIRAIRAIRGSSLLFSVSAALALSLSGSARAAEPAKDAAAPKAQPRVEKNSFGPIEVTITADPPQVELQRDMLLTVRVTAPSEIVAVIPPIDDRLKGFVPNGTIDRGVQTSGKLTTRERQFLVTPVVADEYRLGIMAIQFTDRSKNPPVSNWFATRPVVFQRASLIEGKPGADIKANLAPVWVYPPFKTVAGWVLMAAAAALAAFLLWKLGRKVQRQVKLMRMSPRERALHELAELMSKDLVAKSLVKEFYLELTLIVRRYIERAHAIRAPEQTTEEFLEAVSRDARFTRDVVAKLQSFLQAADLVKFAAHRPDAAEIGRATGTAKDYIETDAVAEEARGQKPEVSKNP